MNTVYRILTMLCWLVAAGLAWQVLQAPGDAANVLKKSGRGLGKTKNPD